MIYRAWFSRLLRHPARKWSGSILTILETACLDGTLRTLVHNAWKHTSASGSRDSAWSERHQ